MTPRVVGVRTDGGATGFRARGAALLFLGGALLGLSSLAVVGPGADRGGIVAVLSLAGVVGLGLLLAGQRMPLWTFHLVPTLGTALIGALLYFRHDGAQGAYAFFYVWVGLWSFSFLSLRWAVAQVAWIALLYGTVLLADGSGSTPVEHWLISVGTVAVAGAFVARLASELHEREEQMSVLLAAARELSATSSAVDARPVICDALLRFSGARSTGIFEPNAEGSALVLTASAGEPIPQKPLPFVGSSSVTVRAFTGAQQVFVGRVEASTLIDRDLQRQTKLASGIWEPVIRDGEAIAVLVVFWEVPLRRVPRRVAELTTMLAAETATTLDRAELMVRLETIARTDELTGLLNRRAWDEELPRELERAKRNGSPICVAIIDLDNFKSYNDQHGHQPGDRLLKLFASTWHTRLRQIDVLARYGGDEFALALAGCDLPTAKTIAEKLRQASPPGLTCSIGIALWNGAESADSLVRRADGALYEAKRSGRNLITATE